MTVTGKSFLVRYGIAVLAAAVGLFLRLLLNPVLGTDSPFITLFPAVTFSALFGGFRAGTLTTVAGIVGAAFFYMEPNYNLSVAQPKDLAQLVIFLAMGIFISWVVSARHRMKVRLRDIEAEAERRARETGEALRASEKKSRLAQKYSGLGIWEWDLQNDRVEWSEGVYQLLGLETGEVEAEVKNWENFVLPEDLEPARATIKKLIAGGQTEFYDEFRIKRAGDGAVRWIASQGQIIRNAENETERLLGVNYDITERKQNELRIKNLNHELDIRINELQAIFDIAPVGIAVAHDATCDVITANPALAVMVGVAPGENVSINNRELSYKHFLNGRELAARELPMQRAVAERRAVLNEEIDIVRADGSLVTIYGYAAPVFDDNGDVVSCVAAQIDITERKKTEIARERKLDAEQALRLEAEEANRLKDEFLATVSHELRTPLNSTIGWIKILHDANLTEETKTRALEAIERGTRAQSQLIEDLLDVSRIISGKLHLQTQPVTLGSIINSALETVRPAATAKDIEIETRLDSQIGLIYGDPDRLQQIVWNLLSNAIKFTPPLGKVEIILQPCGAQAEIIVRDNGKGIREDFLPFVFDRFRQADGSMTRKFTGLGLGLAIVRHLVELHGGAVSVASGGDGKGATFSVKLPSIPALEFGAPLDHSPVEIRQTVVYPKLNDLRILVVDDESDTREILKLFFEQCQAKVETAASAVEGFEKVKGWQPQIIISDIGMPDEDGYSFMQKVRLWEKQNNFPTAIQSVALTAYARREDKLQALVSGFQRHVAKPIEPAVLAKLVVNLIDEDEK